MVKIHTNRLRLGKQIHGTGSQISYRVPDLPHHYNQVFRYGAEKAAKHFSFTGAAGGLTFSDSSH